MTPAPSAARSRDSRWTISYSILKLVRPISETRGRTSSSAGQWTWARKFRFGAAGGRAELGRPVDLAAEVEVGGGERRAVLRLAGVLAQADRREVAHAGRLAVGEIP